MRSRILPTLILLIITLTGGFALPDVAAPSLTLTLSSKPYSFSQSDLSTLTFEGKIDRKLVIDSVDLQNTDLYSLTSGDIFYSIYAEGSNVKLIQGVVSDK